MKCSNLGWTHRCKGVQENNAGILTVSFLPFRIVKWWWPGAVLSEKKKKKRNWMHCTLQGQPFQIVCSSAALEKPCTPIELIYPFSANSDSSQEKSWLTHHMVYLTVLKAQLYATDSMKHPLMPSVKYSFFWTSLAYHLWLANSTPVVYLSSKC